MSAAEVRFDKKQVEMFLKKAQSNSGRLLSDAINKTSAFGIRKVKEELPKRTGNLRGSYQVKKMGKFESEIFSKSPYSNAIEFGSKARVIRAKQGKRLTIPIKKEVLTSTRSQIKQSSLNKLFSRLKNKKRGETSGDIMRDVGIILAKKAKQRARKGQFNIRDKVRLPVENLLKKEVGLAYKKLGFK